MAGKEVAKKASGDVVPSFMKDDVSKGMAQNIDSDDYEIPRLKLLQALSPEIEDGQGKAGQFYHNVLEEPLGETLTVVPIFVFKSFILWNPRHEGGGILARAMDGVHWDNPNGEFEVQPYKDNKKKVTWRTARTVKESGLDQWGSTDPDDPQSQPAATRMINVLLEIVGRPEISPVLLTFQRSTIKYGKKFIGKLKMTNAPSFGIQFELSSFKDANKNGDEYWSMKMTSAGFVPNKDDYDRYSAMYDSFSGMELNIKDLEGMQGEAPDTGGDDDDEASEKMAKRM